jgi:HEAT repeat protein
MTAHVIPFLSGKRLIDTVHGYIDGTLAISSRNSDHMIEILLEGIKIADPDLKLKILLFLGTRGSKFAIDPLYDVMHADDQSEAVRHMAAIQISVVAGTHNDTPRLRARLIRDLGSDDAVIRANAAFALGWEGNTDAAEPLIECLRDEDSDVRQAAVSALCNIGDDRLFKLLVTTLMSGDREQKRTLLFHLYRYSARKTAFENICRRLMDDADSDVRHDALLVFNSVSDPLDNLPCYQHCLRDTDARIRNLALGILLTVDPGRLHPLQRHIQQLLHDPDPNVKQSAIKLYNKIPLSLP